jgi:inosine-uridine nucleoside N-ribohydrolase
MRRSLRRAAAAIATALLAVACSQPAPKPEPPAAPPKLGVVGHVSEVKERGMNQGNWWDAVSTVFSNDPKNVSSVRYEVTVFYDDGTTGKVMVDQKPAVQPGQKVRITGNQIEPVRR